MSEQHSLTRSIILHLAPGAIFTAFIILATPALASAGIDPIFALFGGIGLVLVPIELGYLAVRNRVMFVRLPCEHVSGRRVIGHGR